MREGERSSHPGDELPVLILVAVVVTLYLPSLGFDFVYDDLRFVEANPRIRTLAHPLEFFTDPSTADPGGGWTGIYRPLRTLSFALDYAIFRGRPGGTHLGNLLLHLANTLLAYFMLRRVLAGGGGAARGGRGASLLGALLFAVHPAGVEGVAWASSRDIGLCTVFFLGGFLVYLRPVHRLRERALLALLFALSLLGRETAAVFPGIAFLYDVSVGGGGRPLAGEVRGALARRWKTQAVLLGVLALYLGVRFSVLGEGWGQRGAPWGGSGLVMRWTGIRALGQSAARAVLPFLPAPFTFDTPADLVRGPADPGFLGGLGVTVAALATALCLRRSRPRVFFLVTWFYLALLPTANLLYPVNIFFADRFLYLALLGPAALMGWGVVAACRRWPVLAAVWVSVPFLGFLFLAQWNLEAWRSPLALWGEVLQRSPRDPPPRALHGYAEALGRVPGRRDEAIGILERALSIDPDYTTARGSLGRIRVLEGDLDGGLREFRTLVERAERTGLDPGNRGDYMRALVIVADLCAQAGRSREGIPYAEKLLSFRPGDPALRQWIGELYLASGNVPLAKRYFLEAIGIDPGFGPARRSLRELGEPSPPPPAPPPTERR